jgi:cyclophilin family peptidyl-prolyl cis-trans isomerase
MRAIGIASVLFAGCALVAGAWGGRAHAQAKASSGPSDPALQHPAQLTAHAPEVYRVKLTTTKGDVVVEVTRAWAPLGADRFYNLVTHHYYDQAAFFRVLNQQPRPFVVQFGISADPKVNAVWQGATINDDPVTQHNVRGTVTFAMGGPNTRTTQVFINLNDNSRLDSMGFPPFGKVVEGMDVVDKFNGEYGEGAPSGRGPDQSRIQAEGKAYLDKSFPNLDRIVTAVVISPAGSTKR